MNYTYFPGCSQEGMNVGYGKSIISVAKKLGVNLVELEDWNCCGATIYPSLYDMSFYTINARNLALAEKEKRDLVTPCNACYLALLKSNRYICEEKEIGEKVNKYLKEIGLQYNCTVRVRHILDIFINDVGIEEIKKNVSVPLHGLKVAPYYGCLIVRPYVDFDDPDYPTTLDNLMNALGCEVVNYPPKTKCCGASLITTKEDTCLKMIKPLIGVAVKNKADVIVTLCPMCNFNLEAYQDKINKVYGTKYNIPVLPFTQIMGVALGLKSKELALDKALISADNVLSKYLKK